MIRPTPVPRAARLAAALIVAAVAAGTAAQTSDKRERPALDAHRQEDVAKHRAMAAAHEAAARCLESGAKESECQAALRKACEGIAVGRYCGMKHTH